MSTLIDSYSESNYDSPYWLGGVGHDIIGQSFKPTVTANITAAKFYIERTGTPTGNAYAKLYAHTGSFGGSTGYPTGNPLATSSAIDMSTVSSSYELVTFTFSGTNQYEIQAGTPYCICLDGSSLRGSNIFNNFSFGADDSSPTHSGRFLKYNGSEWYNDGNTDAVFYIYGSGSANTPVISTTTTTLLKKTIARVGGNVTSEGTNPVTERGIYYGTDEFTQATKIDSTTTGEGAFPIIMRGLTADTTYYYKAYATSTIGTSYGDVLSFTTGGNCPVLDALYALPPFTN